MNDENKYNKNPEDENINKYYEELYNNDEELRAENENDSYITEEEKLYLIDNRASQSRHEEEKKKTRSHGSFFSYIAVALIAAIIGGIISPYAGAKLYGNILPAPESNQYAASPVIIQAGQDYTVASAVASKAMSSVVGITTIEEVQARYWLSPQNVEGVGTGVIVDSDGYILTNSHVVRDGNAKIIHVLFENGEKLEAQLLWNEPTLDLAIVKVDKSGLPVAELGDSDQLIVGEAAIAIGNPLGLEFQRTVTAGIISGLNRSIQVEGVVIEDLIQTDASINNGNSGGPLLNSEGQVIGINTAKIKSAEGLGFSIPINEAKIIIEEVIENGSFETVFLGISGVAVEDYEARLGVEVDAEEGIILVQIVSNTPAERAGLRNGDVIVKIDDIEVDGMVKLKKSLFRYKLGDKAELSIIRNGQEMQVEVEFSEVKGAQ